MKKEERQKLKELKASNPKRFKLLLSDEASVQIAKAKKHSRAGLAFQINAALVKLLHKPNHPGLHTHRFESLSSRYNEDVWESYVQNKTPGAWRLFWHFGPGEKTITLLMVTPHP